VKSFSNFNPRSLQATLSLLKESRQGGEIVSLAGGGSDLLGMIKEERIAPDVVVNLKNVASLQGIEAGSNGVRIGGGG